jgi:hypothetical protein
LGFVDQHGGQTAYDTILIAPYSVFGLAQHDSRAFYLTASFYEKAVKYQKPESHS